jgi:hypothetical protein
MTTVKLVFMTLAALTIFFAVIGLFTTGNVSTMFIVNSLAGFVITAFFGAATLGN